MDLGRRGIRSLAVARTNDEGKWTMLGILTFLDPPRPDTKDTIERAMEYGVDVKMITGARGGSPVGVSYGRGAACRAVRARLASCAISPPAPLTNPTHPSPNTHTHTRTHTHTPGHTHAPRQATTA
jgi:hypothetical protein